MKKHVKYILFFILIITSIIISSSILLTNQFFKFYNSYIEEEKEELDHQILLVEWAVKPILKEKNHEKLELFAKNLKDVDIAIFILDENNSPIVQSRNDININEIKTDYFSKKTIKNYKQTLKDKMIAKEKTIFVDNTKYIIKIALLQDNMIEAFLKNQQNIILACLIGIIIIFLLSLIITNMANQLKEKINELKNIEIEKNEMLSGFSHEVKTPLTSIILSCELLSPKSKSTQDIECINILKTNAQRLNELILNIIDISKLEYKTLKSHNDFSDILLEDCIDNAINNCAGIKENIKINFNFNDSIKLNADSQLLETAITNILINAIKYSKTETIDISASKNKDKNNLEIKIRDYGIGIEEKHLNKIFEKFYRVDKTRSRELGGSGLGLAIVKKIIELHKGKISVKSNWFEEEFNKGCEFLIELPLKS